MTEQLKPCPFCGGDPKTTERPDNIDGTRFFYAVACYCDGYSACAHKMAVEPTPEQAKRTAIEAWNRRAQPAQAGQVLTDDALLTMWAGDNPRPVLGKDKVLAYGRAVEAAAQRQQERIAELQAQVQALSLDAGRLDWLATQEGAYRGIDGDLPDLPFWEVCGVEGQNVREAIDAAIAAGKGKN